MHQETGCISGEANHVHGRVIKDLRYETYLKIFSKLTCRFLSLFALVQDILRWLNRLKETKTIV